MNTSKYFLLLLTIILSLPAFSQTQTQPAVEAEADTLAEKFELVRFVRVGIDVSSLARAFIEPEVRQLEVSLDTEFRKNWFLTLEGGMAEVQSEQESFSYNASGFFLRAGTDFNLLGRVDARQNDLVTIGARYGYSMQQHQSPFFTANNPYWGEYAGSIEKSTYHAHWLEFAAGVRTEVLRNFYLGWSIRARVKLYGSKNQALEPYFLPGFGNGNRRAPVMFQYSLMYRFNL